MGLAEDSRKVSMIVEGNSEALANMYNCKLQGAACGPARVQQLSPSVWQQCYSTQSRIHLLSQLPATVLLRLGGELPLSRLYGSHGHSLQRRQLAKAVMETGRHQAMLSSALSHIVRHSSARQAVSGLLAVGLHKSMQYVAAKLSKGWLRF